MNATPQAQHQVVEGGHPSPFAAQLTTEFQRLFNAEGGKVSQGLVRAGWKLNRGNKVDIWEKTQRGITCTAGVVRALRRIGYITHIEVKDLAGVN